MPVAAEAGSDGACRSTRGIPRRHFHCPPHSKLKDGDSVTTRGGARPRFGWIRARSFTSSASQRIPLACEPRRASRGDRPSPTAQRGCCSFTRAGRARSVLDGRFTATVALEAAILMTVTTPIPRSVPCSSSGRALIGASRTPCGRRAVALLLVFRMREPNRPGAATHMLSRTVHLAMSARTPRVVLSTMDQRGFAT